MKEFFTFEDFDFENKTVALRVDLNLPYNPKTGELSETPRLYKHLETIRILMEKGAKTVLLAHQGRKGDEDFISLEKHAKLLEKHLGSKVKFLPFGENFEMIKGLEKGELLILDNTRFYDDEKFDKTIEEHAESKLPKKLAPYIDYFVLDGFSVSHRCHASVVGFANLKPCIAGPVFETEIKNLEEFFEKIKNSKPCFILGGAKPKEPLELMEHWIEKDVSILTTGIISLLFLIAKGYDLGYTKKFLEEKGYLKYMDIIKSLSENFSEKIKIPVDLAIEENGNRVEISVDKLPTEKQILDIGEKTIEEYRKIISESEIVCMKGTSGMYENKNFELGTKKLFELLENNKNSLLGGGNTTDALEKFKIPFDKFGYVSLGGGAFVEFLTGKKLPGIEMLKISFLKFKK